MPIIKTVKLKISPELLEKMLHSYLSGNAPSRISVANSCSVSKVTSGKVAKALLESGFMCERQFALKGERPCLHLFCRESIRVLLIDLSTSVFKMMILNANTEIKFSSEHVYDPTVGFNDNLEIFLSRCGLKLKRSDLKFSSMTVIYADSNSYTHIRSNDAQFYLPTISMKHQIETAINAILSKKPDEHMTVSQAIGEAMKFNAIGNTDVRGGISYIFIGSHISSFHIYSNNAITVCSPYNMLSDEHHKALAKGRFISKNECDSIFVNIANFMDCAFSPSAILLESDLILPDDETADKLSQTFLITRRNTPMILYKTNEYPLRYLGAVRRTIFDLITKYIISDIKHA